MTETVIIPACNWLLNCRRKSSEQFHTKHPLILLSSTRDQLEERLECRILEYVLSNPDGVYYMYDKKLSQMPLVQARYFYSWLKTQQLLARLHRCRFPDPGGGRRTE